MAVLLGLKQEYLTSKNCEFKCLGRDFLGQSVEASSS